MPDLVEWNKVHGMYAPTIYVTTSCDAAREHNARLDTFTRCQETTFSKKELNLLRQWFNAVEDLSPAYLEKSDCDLYRKVREMMK